jgi:hypothetical protein
MQTILMFFIKIASIILFGGLTANSIWFLVDVISYIVAKAEKKENGTIQLQLGYIWSTTSTLAVLAITLIMGIIAVFYYVYRVPKERKNVEKSLSEV